MVTVPTPGQQVSRTIGSGPSAVVTLSVHDLAGNRIAEHDGTGAVLREYIWLDGRPLAVAEGGQTYWLHWDQIGRPAMATDGRAITSADERRVQSSRFQS